MVGMAFVRLNSGDLTPQDTLNVLPIIRSCRRWVRHPMRHQLSWVPIATPTDKMWRVLDRPCSTQYGAMAHEKYLLPILGKCDMNRSPLRRESWAGKRHLGN
jgi:hypothetical protein